MGRGGRGGGFRGGGGRMGGGLGGGRSSSGRGLGSSPLGGGGRGGRGAIPTPGANRGGGLGGGFSAPRPVVRPPVAPRGGRAGSFGAGVGVGMGLGMMGGRRRRRMGWGGGWGWGGRRRMGMGMGMHGGMGMMPRRRGGCGGGCSTLLIMLVLLFIVIAIISTMNNFATPQHWVHDGQWHGVQQGQPAVVDPFPGVIPSTIIRTPLEAGSARETGSLFTDHLGWISNQTALTTGMRNFHQATGVRPHLYLIGEINGNAYPTNPELQAFAEQAYDRLFEDEAHVLLLFFENYNYDYGMWVVAGNQARSVMDQEAQDILMDFVQRYYYQDISEEDLFSRAFDSTAQRIMYRPTPPPEPTDNRPIWITIIVAAGVVLLALILFKWWSRKQEQKNLEAEQTERILSQPLETIGSQGDAASQLAEQYQDDNQDN